MKFIQAVGYSCIVVILDNRIGLPKIKWFYTLSGQIQLFFEGFIFA